MEQRLNAMRTLSMWLMLLCALIMGTIAADKDARPADGLKAFQQIDTIGRVVRFSGSMPDGIQGGHIQGVQWLTYRQTEYALVTGSADACSWFAVIRPETPPQVSVRRLLEKPWKHAGGFQIFDRWLAVGLEDDNAKDKSQVHIYDISDPEQSLAEPVMEVQRSGSPKRATAGCVALSEWKDRMVLAVGDWDSRHLDFYLDHPGDWRNGKRNLQLVCSFDSGKADRSDWIDKRWLSYQNINLFVDRKDRLFLVAMGQDEEKKNLADLYLVETKDFKNMTLKKIAQKEFHCSDGASFRLASGILTAGKDSLGIVTCSGTIGGDSAINLFLARGAKK